MENSFTLISDGNPSISSRSRILIVDDNIPSAQSLGSIVRHWGYDSRVAFGGRQAISEALAYRPDVIIMDINMPGMNGYEVALAIRSELSLVSTILVAMTGYNDPEDIRRAFEAGFDHHFVKPLELERLQSYVFELSRHSPGR